MAHIEELKINVRIVGDAATGLREINQRLQALGGQPGLQQFAGDLRRIEEALKQANREASYFGQNFDRNVTSAFRTGYARIIGMQTAALGLYATITSVARRMQDLARETIDISVLARSISAGGGTFFKIAEGLQRIGYTSAEARREIVNFFTTVTQALRAGTSEQMRILTNAANPEQVFAMLQRWQVMADAGDFAGPLIEAAREARAVFDNEMARSGSKTKAAAAQAAFIRDLGLTARAADIQSLMNGGPQEEERFRRREAAMRAWNEEWRKLNEVIDEVITLVVTELIPAIKEVLPENLGERLKEALKIEVETAKRLIALVGALSAGEFKAAARILLGPEQPGEPQSPLRSYLNDEGTLAGAIRDMMLGIARPPSTGGAPAATTPQRFADVAMDQEKTRKLDSLTNELKRLNDWLHLPENEFFGLLQGGGEAGAPGGGGRSRFPGMGGGRGGGAPYGSSVGPGTGPGAGTNDKSGGGSDSPGKPVEDLGPIDTEGLKVVDATGRSTRSWEQFKQQPEAIITHFTGGSTLSGAISTLNQRGLGYNYIIDKDGTVHQFVPTGRRGAHMLPGWGAQGQGLSNQNTIGISAVGSGEGDLTPAQIQAMRTLTTKLGIKYNIPPSKVFGHGEVNPGHRHGSEGRSTYEWARGLKQWPGQGQQQPAPPPADGKQSSLQGDGAARAVGFLPIPSDERLREVAQGQNIQDTPFDPEAELRRGSSIPRFDTKLTAGWDRMITDPANIARGAARIQDERADKYDPETGEPLALYRNPPTLGKLFDPRTGQQIGVGGSPLQSVYGKAQSGSGRLGQQLDRSLLSDTDPGAGGANVSGTLSVDVRAPRGTKVEAEGDGAFTKTEVERSTPLETQ